MWGQPCHSLSSYSIPFHLTALLPPSVPLSTHTGLVNGSLSTTANHSHSLLYLLPRRNKTAPASVLPSHAYQLCQPAYARADWTAGERNKRIPFGPTRFIHSEMSNRQHTSRQKIRRPTTRPHSLMDRAHHRSPGILQQHSAPVAASIPPRTFGQPTG